MSCKGRQLYSCTHVAYSANLPSARSVLVFVLMRSNSLVFLELSCSLLDSLLSADVKKLLDYIVVILQIISELFLLESHLGSAIIKATILGAQQEFICLSCQSDKPSVSSPYKDFPVGSTILLLL